MSTELEYGLIDENLTVSSKDQIVIPDFYSFQVLLDSLSIHREIPIVIDAESGEILNGQELRRRAILIALSLCDIGEGSRVFCFCLDSALYATTILAVQFAGLIYSGNFWMITKREVRNQVSDLEAKVIFCSPINLETASEVADEVDSVIKVIVLGSTRQTMTSKGKAVVMITNLMQQSKDSIEKYQPVIPRLVPAEAPVYIMYSSGSTGLPKGCIITHKNDVARCQAIAQRQSSDRKIVSLTVGFPHTVGLMMLHVAIMKGNTLVIDNQLELDMDRFLRVIEKYRCTSTWLGPSQATALSKNLHLLNKFDVSSLKEIKTGGAVLSDAIAQSFHHQTEGRVRLRNVYGLTEVGDITIMPDDVSGSTVGSLVAAQYIRVIDRETGKALPIGKVGEIFVHGPQVFAGYFKRPDANQEHFTEDGWFQTGDMGYFDQRGLLFIIDRFKEVIKVFGEQVTPAELESVLLSHEAVAEAAVVGIPDQETCEAPVAFVVLKPGHMLSQEQLLQFVHHQVVDYKEIRGGVHFVDSLPLISIGKIDRKQLKAAAMRRT